MLRRRGLAVIVPAHNEARLICETLAGIPPWIDEVIVVDDASTDATATIVERWSDHRVRLIRHPTNAGVGAAIVTGYREAFGLGETGRERGAADIAAVMAGDAQMHPADLRRVIQPVLDGHADYAKGDRLSWPRARSLMPTTRWLGNHLLSVLTRWATGLTVRDSQCGYTAISQAAAARLDLAALWPRYGYPNDMLGRLAEHGMEVHDVTVRPVYGVERSGIGVQHALLIVPYVLLRAMIRRWFGAGAMTTPATQ